MYRSKPVQCEPEAQDGFPDIVILNLHPALVLGGCEQLMRQLSDCARTRGKAVVWYGGSEDFYAFLTAVYKSLGLQASPLRLTPPYDFGATISKFSFRDLLPFTAEWRRVRSLFRRSRSIYTKNEFLEVLLLWYFGGRRALAKTTVGMHTPLSLPREKGVWFLVHEWLYKSALYRLALWQARSFHSPSSAVHNDLKYVFGDSADEIRERVFIIPNGIDVPTSAPVATVGDLRLLCVGRICWQKGFDRIASHIKDLPYELTIVGDGDNAALLRSLLGDKGKFVGSVPRDEVAQFMCENDVLLMPSRWENHPLTLLEALAYGMVPVVQKLPQLAEQLPQEYRWLAIDFDEAGSLVDCVRRIKSLKGDTNAWLQVKRDMWAHAMRHFNNRLVLNNLVDAVTGVK